MFNNRLVGNFMRRHAFARHRAAIPNQQVAILHAGMKGQPFASQLFLERAHQRLSLFCADMPGGIVVHHPVDHRHQIAAKGHIRLRHRDFRPGGFDRCAAGIVLRRVVSKQGHVGDIGTRRQAVRDGPHQAHFPRRRDLSNGWNVRRLQGRLAAQRFNRVVPHAIAN